MWQTVHVTLDNQANTHILIILLLFNLGIFLSILASCEHYLMQLCLVLDKLIFSMAELSLNDESWKQFIDRYGKKIQCTINILLHSSYNKGIAFTLTIIFSLA